MQNDFPQQDITATILRATLVLGGACAPPAEVNSTETSSSSGKQETEKSSSSFSPSSSLTSLPEEPAEENTATGSELESNGETNEEESDDLSSEETISLESSEDSEDAVTDGDDDDDNPTGPKFDIIGPDVPILPTQCEEEGLEDPVAGIYCVLWSPKHIFLGDSNGDGRIEVGVTRHPGHIQSISIFEQANGQLEELADSPFDLPVTSSGRRPESARIVALPRSLGPEQDWLAMLERTAIERNGDSGGPFLVFGAATILYPSAPDEWRLLSDWRDKGAWQAQAVALDAGSGYATVMADRNGQLTVKVRDAQDQWGAATMYHDLQGMPVGIETADFNADGHQDIVIFGFNYPGDAPPTHQGIAVRFGDGHGNFSTLQHNQVDHQVYAIVEAKLGDVTGDGLLDAILMDETELHVVAGLGEGLFAGDRPQTIPIPSSSNSSWNLTAIHAADFNGDQRVDVALSDCLHDKLHILLANPDDQLELISSTPTVDCVQLQYLTDSLNALDVNEDGHLDLLALGEETETLRVYFGDDQEGFEVH